MKDSCGVLLKKLLDRLYATLTQGPCLNARVHHSRQRIDLRAFEALDSLDPGQLLPKLLTGSHRVEIRGEVPPFNAPDSEESLTMPQRDALKAWKAQLRLLGKLRDIAEDARNYEEATGENALFIGFPLLSLPKGSQLGGREALTSRIVAPLVFAPIDLSVRRGAVHSVTISAKGEGSDLLVPNFPLLAWLEQQTGKDTSELFADEDGAQPWREVNAIADLVCEYLALPEAPEFEPATPLVNVPRAQVLPDRPEFLNAAVLGLFPLSNPGLLRDLKAMSEGHDIHGPVEFFLSAAAADPVAGTADSRVDAPEQPRSTVPVHSKQRFVAAADPFQARAVRLAEEHPVLVIHGPPGTGKSQTITNIIGDHLARGERVLMVCDKRTAIDVVKNRLDHLGLGDLCALVHDPQRDQNPLYMKIRGCLESLSDRKTRSESGPELRKLDEELERVHETLRTYFTALNRVPAPGAYSFHGLVGEWLALDETKAVEAGQLQGAELAQLWEVETEIREVLERACKAAYNDNPWVAAAGIQLGDYLAQPAEVFRDRIKALHKAAEDLDALHDGGHLPLTREQPLLGQADGRLRLAERLRELDRLGMGAARRPWFERPRETVARTLSQLEQLAPLVRSIQSEPLNREMLLAHDGEFPSIRELAKSMSTLASYAAIAGHWYGFLFFGRRRAARQLLEPYGLDASKASAEAVVEFLEGVKARLTCQDFLRQDLGFELTGGGLMSDGDLLSQLNDYKSLLEIMQGMQDNAAVDAIRPQVSEALQGNPSVLADKLDASASRARQLSQFINWAEETSLFSTDWLNGVDHGLRNHDKAAPRVQQLAERMDRLEDVLRARKTWSELPAVFQPVVQELMRGAVNAEEGIQAIRKSLLADTISLRIRENPHLQEIDAERINSLFERLTRLQVKKRKLSAEFIQDIWTEVQKTRLLDPGRKRLNGAGAALKRRLFTRGKRAMKLRQMIRHGSKGSTTDPLFDMCPVWLASPATVAQIFPRQAAFDVMIFDEASQCRLEEAIPVLTRGRRVVVAGDTKQLPPTRFFESAFSETEFEEAESEQELFEQQQSEVEDLLTATLNAPVPRSYLDVHYRSRHESLIQFSNLHFYQGRLQPVPGHPSKRPVKPPIELVRVDGLYEKRCNDKEAAQVAAIVRELLMKPKPPSIGIACFNLVQRDLILDKLEALAEAQPDFAKRYDEARERRGEGSFEGLFVKNLENVQGDERDHIIISTTFGPDAEGGFRRNFGPISRQGGGRRLNVLVTRAREKIHLVTSIPRSEYASLPELESGQVPGGRWILYAYLHYAESLQSEFGDLATPTELTEEPAGAEVEIHESNAASSLAVALAKRLAASAGQNSVVHWGNDGFCVDVALRPGMDKMRVSLGLLCDMTRFDQAADPVEWDLFRAAMLAAQGWKLHRVWSPGLFLDLARHERDILAANQAAFGKGSP